MTILMEHLINIRLNCKKLLNFGVEPIGVKKLIRCTIKNIILKLMNRLISNTKVHMQLVRLEPTKGLPCFCALRGRNLSKITRAGLLCLDPTFTKNSIALLIMFYKKAEESLVNIFSHTTDTNLCVFSIKDETGNCLTRLTILI